MYIKDKKFFLTDNPLTVNGERRKVVVLYADIRGFSDWSKDISLTKVSELVQIVYERVIQLSVDYYHVFHKFLGDGFLLLWEVPNGEDYSNYISLAIGASFEIHKKYWYLYAGDKTLPSGFGIGISCGEAVKIQPATFIPELNELDFVGYPMNCGARMQTLAGAYGVVIDSAVSKVVSENIDNKFSNFELLNADEHSLLRAKVFKGLRVYDKKDFKYLTYPVLQKSLWETDGMFKK